MIELTWLLLSKLTWLCLTQCLTFCSLKRLKAANWLKQLLHLLIWVISRRIDVAVCYILDQVHHPAGITAIGKLRRLMVGLVWIWDVWEPLDLDCLMNKVHWWLYQRISQIKSLIDLQLSDVWYWRSPVGNRTGFWIPCRISLVYFWIGKWVKAIGAYCPVGYTCCAYP